MGLRRRPLVPGATARGYARYSSEMQNESSLAYQRANIQQFCTRYGLKLDRIHEDAARSGTTLVNRPALLDLMACARQGDFQVLVVDAQDRLSRDQADTHRLLKELDQLGVIVASVRTGGVIDAMQATIAGLQASTEVENLRDRVRSGQREAVRRGRSGGALAYGYRIVRTAAQARGLREIDSATRPVVRRIFRELLAGVSPTAIVAGLNRDGIPSPHADRKRPGAKKPPLCGRRAPFLAASSMGAACFATRSIVV